MKKILIAEDNDSNYLLVSTILKGKYELLRAVNGAEAIEKAHTFEPDIILMDWKMPVMNGLDATIGIRAFAPDLPIIAITAYAFDTDKQQALAAGCNEFITKPINIKELLATLGKY